MKVIVIGGDAAGMSAASRVRKYAPDSEVVVYEAGEHVSYSACGMPFYIGGEVREFDDLIHYPVSKFVQERKINVQLNSRVTGLDTSRREVTVERNGETVQDHYDRLIIATGARPAIPEEFRGKNNVHTLRHIDDLLPLEESLETVQKVTIVGAGYVGMEMADALSKMGKEVTVIQRSERVLRGLDEEFTYMISKELESNKVTLLLNSPVKGIDENNGIITSIKAGQKSVPTDAVFIATGIVPNSEFAKDAGIRISNSGAILVNERMQTSAPMVYAAGDVATTKNIVTGREMYFPLATGSNKSGRIAGENAAGKRSTYAGIVGTEVVKLFSLEIGRTGLDEKEARMNKFRPVASTITSTSRASYYPGASPLKIKLVADENTHRLLGGILIGKEGVAKRLDVLATALYCKMKIEDLTRIDYSYSPPFSPAWEPLGVAADVLMGKL